MFDFFKKIKKKATDVLGGLATKSRTTRDTLDRVVPQVVRRSSDVMQRVPQTVVHYREEAREIPTVLSRVASNTARQARTGAAKMPELIPKYQQKAKRAVAPVQRTYGIAQNVMPKVSRTVQQRVVPRITHAVGAVERKNQGAKNAYQAAGRAVLDDFRGNINALKRGELAQHTTNKMERVKFLQPSTTGKVRVRDFVREIPTGAQETGKGILRESARVALSAKEAPRTLITGRASGQWYNTPLGRINSLQSEAQNRVRRGDSPAKAIANTTLDLFLGAGDIAGALKPTMHAAKTLPLMPKEAKNIADDLTRALKSRMDWKSGLMQGMSHPGMTVKSTKPKNYQTPAGARKDVMAKNIVNKQIANQAQGASRAEKGFVAPKNIPLVSQKTPQDALFEEARKHKMFNAAHRAQNISPPKRTDMQNNLSQAIKSGTDEPVFFGRLSKDKLKQVNILRINGGKPPIKSRDIYFHPNVIEKLRNNRVSLDGLTPQAVSDMAYSALHNAKSRVLATSHPHIQKMVKVSENYSPQTFVGEHGGSVSAKSVYPTATARITKSTTDGPATPSSNFSAQGVDTLRQSAGFSDLRGASGTVNDSIQYPKNQAEWRGGEQRQRLVHTLRALQTQKNSNGSFPVAKKQAMPMYLQERKPHDPFDAQQQKRSSLLSPPEMYRRHILNEEVRHNRPDILESIDQQRPYGKNEFRNPLVPGPEALYKELRSIGAYRTKKEAEKIGLKEGYSLLDRLRTKLDPSYPAKKEAAERMVRFNADIRTAGELGTEKGLAYLNKNAHVDPADYDRIIRAMDNPFAADEDIAPIVRTMRGDLDQFYKEAQEAGLDVGYWQNYIPHIWEESPQVVAKKTEDALAAGIIGEHELSTAQHHTKTPYFGHAHSRKIISYDIGERIGLHKKYDNPAQIIAHYVRRLEEGKAILKHIRALEEDKLVSRVYEPGMKPLSVEGMTGLYADATVADKIDNMLRTDEKKNWLSHVANTSRVLKQILMSGGIPFSTVNSYGLGMTLKEVGTMNPYRIAGAVKSFVVSNSPEYSRQFFIDNIDQIKKIRQQDINISTMIDDGGFVAHNFLRRMFGFGEGSTKWEKTKAVFHKMADEPTFRRFLPMQQIIMFNHVESVMIKKGYAPYDAQRIAGQSLREAMGLGSASEAATASQAKRDLLEAAFFAPTHRANMIRMWVNSWMKTPWRIMRNTVHGKAPLQPSEGYAAQFMLGSMITYGMYDWVNYRQTGRHLYENPEGKKFEAYIHLGGGEYISVPMFPTVMTMPRLGFEVGENLAQGNIKTASATAYRGTASLLTKPISDAIMNKDYFDRPIYDEVEDEAGQKYAKILGYLGKQYTTPQPYVKAGIEKYKGNPNVQVLTQAFEAPVRFTNDAAITKKMFYGAYKKHQPIVEKYENLLKFNDPQATDYYKKHKNAIDTYYAYQPYASVYNKYKYDKENPKDAIEILKKGMADNGQKVSAATTAYDNEIAGKAAIQKAMRAMSQDEQAAYHSLGKTNDLNPWGKIQKYTTMRLYPAVFEAKRAQAIARAQGNMDEVDPLYRKTWDEVRQFLVYQTMLPNSSTRKAIRNADPSVAKLLQERSTYFKSHPIENDEKIQEGSGLLSYPEADAETQSLMNAKQWKNPKVQEYFNKKDAYDAQVYALAGVPNVEGGYGFGYGGGRKGDKVTQLHTAQLTNAKNKGNFKAWLGITENSIAELERQLTDPSITDTKALQIENKIVSLQNQRDRYIAQGGFMAPKKQKEMPREFRYRLVDPVLDEVNGIIAGYKARAARARRSVPLMPRTVMPPRVTRTIYS